MTATRRLPPRHRKPNPASNQRNVGLTGGIGAGKSEVARRFAALGATIIDADAIAREVVALGTPGLAAVIAAFGEGVRAVDGGLDREKLAAVVFTDDDERLRLNAIVHPLVGDRVAELMAAADEDDPAGIIIHDVPLITESGLTGRYVAVVVVDAPLEVQLTRLTQLRGMTEQAARDRIAAQATREQRRAIADHLITNDGDLDALQAQVEQVWASLGAMETA
jgi:dephospho-CoA kinase